MKKIFLMLATAVLAASCSDWGGSTPETVKVGYVDKLMYSSGEVVSFDYNDKGYVTLISSSAGWNIAVTYEENGIAIHNGETEQLLKIESGYITSVMEGDTTVSTLHYMYMGYNGYLSSISNNVENVESNLNWSGNMVFLPTLQTNKRYSEGQRELLSTQTIGYSYSPTAPFNVYVNLNFLPLVVPEYTQSTGVNNFVLAALGGLRTYYLPTDVKVTTRQEGEETASDVSRTYTYTVDQEGYYIQSVSVNGIKSFDVVYRVFENSAQ